MGILTGLGVTSIRSMPSSARCAIQAETPAKCLAKYAASCAIPGPATPCTQARLAVSRATLDGIGLPWGLLRWNCGLSLRGKRPRLAMLPWAVAAHTSLVVFCRSSSTPS